MTALDGRRLLVVGASSGIGRATGLACAAAGARVVFAARRRQLLRDAAVEAGNGSVAVVCDVRDETSVTAAVTEASEALDGLDSVVYASGVSPLVGLADADVERWRWVLETNVVGAASVLRAALPHLRGADAPRIAVLSSHSVADPWPGLVPYVVSKSALDALVAGWRAEIPDVPLSRIVVGPTATDFASVWDEDVAATMFTRWAEEGRLPEDAQVMTVQDVAREVVHVLASPVALTDVRVLPPAPS